MLSSTSSNFACNSLRPTSSARTSWASSDLACTGRYQPMRSNCAIPRASLRSVFTVIADSAAFTCRVSSNTTSKPASTRPSRNHCDSGPASRPTRMTGNPRSAKCFNSASGSLATFVSHTILPDESARQTLLSSSDTSIPA